jgi:tetratricopeptide (TPR) repeat protein/predicted Ser/Thr protein kinase
MPNEREARLAELAKGAIDRPPEAWAAYLNEECGADAELRAEIETLLEQQAPATRFLEEPAVHLAAESLVAGGAFKAGDVIEHYEIVSLIGSGGMGEVYLAQDLELRRHVALKLVRRGLASDEMRRHFQREVHVLASLNHPNIAQLYGSGLTSDGVPFFVMEYVEGEPLDSYCGAQKLATEKRLELFRKVCAAVTYAHQRLVIHRDLKPANIRVTAEGEPKLLDFGIAKLIDPAPERDSAMATTLPGAMTPGYASPEQVRGESMTTASDVYSLGVILYELLTGARPYRFTTGLHEVSRAITEETPLRPSSVTKVGSPKALRGDLDNIVLMAMRKEPERRYTSVGQFSADIGRHLEGRPVIARKDTVAYRSAKFVRRYRVQVAAAILVLLSLIGGLLVSVRQARLAERERVKAEAINNFLQDMLAASVPESKLRQRREELRVKDVLDDASSRLRDQQLSTQPAVRAELQRIIGATYLALGQYDLAGTNLSAALSAQEKIYGAENLETLKTAASLGKLWMAQGDYARAEPFYRQNLPAFRTAYKQHALKGAVLGSALGDFALLRRVRGDSKDAEQLVRERLALGEEELGDLSGIRAILALTLADQGSFDEAIGIVRTELARLRERSPTATPELCATLTGLGSFLVETGDTTEAIEHLQEAEAGYRRLYDQSNLQLGDNLRLQAQAFYLAGNYPTAESKIDEALKIYRAGAKPQYVNFATALMVQGFIYGRTDRPAAAEELFRNAVTLRSENLPPEHFLRAVADGALGEFLTAQNRLAEAESFLMRSFEALSKSQQSHSPRTRLALQRLIALNEKSGRPELASQYREKLAGN